MRLTVLLPFCVFLRHEDVMRVVADTGGGSIGLLPHRLDCVAELRPGLLSYGTNDGIDHYIAVDEGVLIKAGDDVLVSVRRAIGGQNLNRLRDAVTHEFMVESDGERRARRAVRNLETNLLGRLAEWDHGR